MRRLRVLLPALLAAAAAVEREPALLAAGQEGDGLAVRHPGDRGIEGDPRVVLADGFEEADPRRRWTEAKSFPGTVEYVRDAASVHVGASALKITATLARDTGGHLYKKLDPGRERLHVRFYVKFPKDHGYVHHFVHLCGYNPATDWPQGGAGERPAGSERFSTGIEPHGDWGRAPAPGRWEFYSYWCEMKGSPDGKFWGNSPKGGAEIPIPTDRWICVEFMLKCNTVGRDDGEQAFWIDGKCAGRWGGYRWRTDPALNANGLWLLYYVTENAAKQNHAEPKPSDFVLFDDVVAATEYIGPMAPADGAAPPPEAPAPATPPGKKKRRSKAP